MNASQPIGIFDSGIGGLTIMQAVVATLPRENIIYFGDTAHLPYGDKSAAAIQAYAVKIAELLLQRQCKLILIACNSASAAAYGLVQEYVSGKALVMNVIDPIIDYLGQYYAHKRIGLIGTKQTIYSDIYGQKITALGKNITLAAHATPLLAKAIEEGFANPPIINALLTAYLAHPALQDIVALILGCTHYPIIKQNIKAIVSPQVDIIDASPIVATAVKTALLNGGLINSKGEGNKQFLVSDYTETFARGTQLFFSSPVALTHYPLE